MHDEVMKASQGDTLLMLCVLGTQNSRDYEMNSVGHKFSFFHTHYLEFIITIYLKYAKVWHRPICCFSRRLFINQKPS